MDLDSPGFGPIFSWIYTTRHFGLGILGLSMFNLDMDPELSPGSRNTLAVVVILRDARRNHNGKGEPFIISLGRRSSPLAMTSRGRLPAWTYHESPASGRDDAG